MAISAKGEMLPFGGSPGPRSNRIDRAGYRRPMRIMVVIWPMMAIIDTKTDVSALIWRPSPSRSSVFWYVAAPGVCDPADLRLSCLSGR